ncbi:unnamed protein product [Anisakis simplex]|uniref:CS domain-containing protein n=1 Tax=Anisakis simplex TaxID=6269 RepID=A0A0M3K0Q7_ANISI|nr:unnamed protein product [Anisakis simplex]
MMDRSPSELRLLPGPTGVKYDDALMTLTVHLVVMGIRGKTFARAANTDVHLKYDDQSFSILLEVFKLNKKAKPPIKDVLDTRFYEMEKCPGKITKCEYKLKKNQCILTLHKAAPALWANILSL